MQGNSQIMQGSKCPTLPSVLPLMYEGIQRLAEETPTTVPCTVLDEELRPQTFHSGDFLDASNEARAAVHGDIHRRFKAFKEELPEERKFVYAIATCCDPRYKHFKFNGADTNLREFAHSAAKFEFENVWMNKPLPQGSKSTPTTTPTSGSSATSTRAPTSSCSADAAIPLDRVQPPLTCH